MESQFNEKYRDEFEYNGTTSYKSKHSTIAV